MHVKRRTQHNTRVHSEKPSTVATMNEPIPECFIVRSIDELDASSETIVIGNITNVFTPYTNSAKKHLGLITNRKVVRKRYSHIMNALQKTCRDKKFVENILALPQFRKVTTKKEEQQFRCGVEEGLNLARRQFESIADLVAGGLMPIETYTRFSNLLTHTSSNDVPETTIDLQAKIMETKENMESYWNGTATTVQSSTMIDELLKNEFVLNKVIEMVDDMGGYAAVHRARKQTEIAKMMHVWCNTNDNPLVKKCADCFTGSHQGKVIRDIFTFQTSRIVVRNVRYRNERPMLVDYRGNQHKMFRLRNGREVMKETKKFVVGQELDEQPPSVLRKDDTTGNWYLHYLDTRIDIISLACDRRYTYVGNIEYRTSDSGKRVRIRHLDARVLLIIKLYRCYQHDLFLEQARDTEHKIDIICWMDGSTMDKCGRSDCCIQLVPNKTLWKLQNEKQKAFIRTPLSTQIIWDSEDTETVTILGRLAVEDFINLSTFKFPHPDGYLVSFECRFFVADNKAANAIMGKQQGGHLRCKHCAAKFNDAKDITDYVKCRCVAETSLTLQSVLDRAKKHGRKIVKDEPSGLRRISGFFYDFFCDKRTKVDINDEHSSVFSLCTTQWLRACLTDSRYKLLDDAYAHYCAFGTVSNCMIIDGHLQCDIDIPVEENARVTRKVKFRISTIFEDIQSGRIDESNIVDILFVLIYVHYNRKHVTLSDFGLRHMVIVSDAPHNIAGFDDRLFRFIVNEASSNSSLLKERYRREMHKNRSTMNHSDKRVAILKGFRIFFGEDVRPASTTLSVDDRDDSVFDTGDSTPDMDSMIDLHDNHDSTAGCQQLTHNSMADSSTTGSHVSTDSGPTATDSVVKSSIDNLKWIILLQQLLIRQCSLSEEKKHVDAKKEQFIFHWVSFLLFALCIERYGFDIMCNYLHDIGIHMPHQFEKISFSTINGDMFEEVFAEWKLFMRTSCHRKAEAEVSGLIKRNKIDHFYLLHPALKRSKSRTLIKAMLELQDVHNVVLKRDFLQSKMWHAMIKAKIDELKSGYEKFFHWIPNGDLLLVFTGNIASPVYLPMVSMLCTDAPDIAKNDCTRQGCTNKAKSTRCELCADCCIHNNCIRASPNGEEVCVPHSMTNQERIRSNEQLRDDSSPVTGSNVQTKVSKRRMKPTCPVPPVIGKRNKDPTVENDSKKQKLTSDPVSVVNGSVGACKCNSTCMSNKCPCKREKVDCTDECHKTQTGKLNASFRKCKRKPKVQAQAETPTVHQTIIPDGAIVRLFRRKAKIGTGRVVRYLAKERQYEIELVSKEPSKQWGTNELIGTKKLFTTNQVLLERDP